MRKPLSHPKLDEISLEGVLHALGDPVRLRIVAQLWYGKEAPCSRLGDGLPKSTLSRHFQLLRERGLIRQRRAGTAVLNTLRRAELEELFPQLLETIFRAWQLRSATP